MGDGGAPRSSPGREPPPVIGRAIGEVVRWQRGTTAGTHVAARTHIATGTHVTTGSHVLRQGAYSPPGRSVRRRQGEDHRCSDPSTDLGVDRESGVHPDRSAWVWAGRRGRKDQGLAYPTLPAMFALEIGAIGGAARTTGAIATATHVGIVLKGHVPAAACFEGF